ncbi:MAG: M16 family metallopeptidase [Alphaproteobacteria bacterium]
MVKTLRLPNGVTCVVDQRPETGMVAMKIAIKSGAAEDPDDKQGLTTLMQEVTVAGTKTRSREQIAEEVESKGGGLGGNVTQDATSYSAMSLARYTGETFAVLADIIRNPVFDPGETKNAMEQLAQAIIASGEDAQAIAQKKFFEIAFKGQALGRDATGTLESLETLTSDDLKARHAALLADPSRIVVSFSGDIDPVAAEKIVAQHFGDLAGPKITTTPVYTFTPGYYAEEKENDQLNIFMGFPAPSLRDPDRFAMILLNDLLAGGMSTPLFQELREKRSLVYTPGAEYMPLDTTGTFVVVAGTGQGKAGELVPAVMEMLAKYAREGFDDKAMEEARGRIFRELANSTETAGRTASQNAGHILNKGRIVPEGEFKAQIEAVTTDDIRRVCANMLKSGQCALTAVGPLDTLPTQDEIIAKMAEVSKDLVSPPRAHTGGLRATFAAAAEKKKATLPEPKITVLPNGLKIITVERPGPLSAGAWVEAGADHETPELNGATHMNEHMMFKGTPKYAPGSIAGIVEGELGGSLNAGTSKDKTCYYMYGLEAGAMPKIVDIVGQMVFFANIDEVEYAGGKEVINAKGEKIISKGEREAVFEEMRMYADDVSSCLGELMDALAYPGTAHSRPVLGTKESLMGISAQMLRDYRDQYYAPNKVIFCAVGPVKHEDFVKEIEAQYGHLKPMETAPLPVPAYTGGTEAIENKNAKLVAVHIAAEGASKTDPDVEAWRAFTTLLSGGASAIMQREIVDKQHLAPGVGAGNMAYRNCGTFLMASQVEAQKVKPLVNAMYQCIRDLAATVTEADLEKVRVKMEMGVLAGLEANQKACNAYAVAAQDKGRLVVPSEQAEAMQKVTVADVRRIAAKVLASNPTGAMIVPPGTDKSLLPTQEELISMRDGTWKPAAPAPKADGPASGR